MTRRIDAKRRRLVSEDATNPETWHELVERQARHQRLTSRPLFGAADFAAQLADKLNDSSTSEKKPTEAKEGDADDPLLGLAPNQDPKVANPSKGRRSKVVVKG